MLYSLPNAGPPQDLASCGIEFSPRAKPSGNRLSQAGTLVAALAVSACFNTAPVAFNSLSPRPPLEVFNCALSKVNQLDYMVVDANREAGFIRAEKQSSGAASDILFNEAAHDQLAISVFETNGRTNLRVNASSTSQKTTGPATGQRKNEAPTKRVKTAAGEIMASCGQGAEAIGGRSSPSTSGKATAIPPAVSTPAHSSVSQPSSLAQVRVTAVAANVRARPDLTGDVIIVLRQGVVLPVVDTKGSWVTVELSPELGVTASKGYMHRSTVQLLGGQTPSNIQAKPEASSVNSQVTPTAPPNAPSQVKSSDPGFAPRIQASYTPKDADLARSRAYICPGCGHFYTGDTGIGLVLAGVGIGGAAYFVLKGLAKEEYCYYHDLFDLVCDEESGTGDLLTAAAFFGGAWLIGVIDAPTSAVRMNRKFGINVGLMPRASGLAMQVSVPTR